MRPAARNHRRTMATAFVLWGSIAVAVGTGCIPIYTPLVVQDITTGEKLRGLQEERTRPQDDRLIGPLDATVPPPGPAERGAACDAVRAQLLAKPPALVARAYGDESTTSTSWSFFNPGLYNPVDRERTDLRRARDAGLITAAECEELEGMLDRQAEKPLLRRSFETTGVAVEDGLHWYYLGSSYDEWDEANRAAHRKYWARELVAGHCALPKLRKQASDASNPNKQWSQNLLRHEEAVDPNDIRDMYTACPLVFWIRPPEATH
jgi:hypothetical protein